MKRHHDLVSLSHDHHLSLVLAKKCREYAKATPADQIRFLKDNIPIFEDLIYGHFVIEDNTILNIEINVDLNAESITKGDSLLAFNSLCTQLKSEHTKMVLMYTALANGELEHMTEFAQLLHQHTRTEERELFPLVEELFTPSQLSCVLNACQQPENEHAIIG